MSTFQGGLSPRAAHTAVYVAATDALYVFGGYDLNNVLGSLQVITCDFNTIYVQYTTLVCVRRFTGSIKAHGKTSGAFRCAVAIFPTRLTTLL